MVRSKASPTCTWCRRVFTLQFACRTAARKRALTRGCVCVLARALQSLAQRVKAFGIAHPDSVKQWKKLNTEYNVAAMKLLQNEDFETVHPGVPL
jgi:transposase-like protein